MRSPVGLNSAWTAAWCAVGLAFPWSNAFMSVAIGGLALVSLVSLWQTRSEPAPLRWRGTGLALVALVFWSGLSGLWSADVAGTVQDVRIKLPLVVCGLALWAGQGRHSLGSAEVRRILLCAVMSATAASWACIGLDVMEGMPYGGRESSRFISHIRFGLWWAVLLPWAAARLAKGWTLLAVVTAFVTWTWTESLSGLLAGGATFLWWGPMLLAHWTQSKGPAWPSRKQVRARLAASGVLGLLLLGAVAWSLPTAYPDAEYLPMRTAKGEAYVHQLDRRVTENGHFIWTCVAWGELASTWKERSRVPFDTASPRLIRFLASKGLTKDAAGVAALTDEEVTAIDSGYASWVEWRGVGWTQRWNRMRFNWGQWIDGRRTEGASLLARGVYQGTAWAAITEGASAGRLLFGVGSGDAWAAMEQAYEIYRPAWPEASRHRPHQQFLSLWLGLGAIGLFLWGWALLGGLHIREAWPAVLVLALSGLTEDTLQTQAGVTLALWCLALPGWLNRTSTSPAPPLQ